MPMLYRSPVTRWFLVVVGVVTGALLAFGDGQRWRSTTSLKWLAQAPVPLQVWGALFIVYGLLLLFERTRWIGYAIGAGLFAIFTVSLLATIHPTAPNPKNIVVVAAMLDVTVFHGYSIRTSMLHEHQRRVTP